MSLGYQYQVRVQDRILFLIYGERSDLCSPYLISCTVDTHSYLSSMLSVATLTSYYSYRIFAFVLLFYTFKTPYKKA
jgi:hypothetical protein|nr:MAG TPA: hypothetical protein [Caudoviricetes sp.]